MRTKFIFINEYDQAPLELYLNQQSEQGSHAIKVNVVRIQFEYDPNVRYYYKVLNKENIIGNSTTVNDYKKHAFFMESFGYEAISGYPLLVYRTQNATEFYTDPEVDDIQEKIVRRKLNKTYFFPLMAITLGYYNLTSFGFYRVLTSGILQIALLLNTLYLIYTIRSIYKAYSRKSSVPVHLGARWKAQTIDSFTLIHVVSLVVLIGLVIPPNTLMLYLPLIIVAVAFVISSTISMSRRNKWIFYGIVTALMIVTLNITMTHSLFKERTSSRYTYSSLLATEITEFKTNTATSMESSLQIKLPIAKDYLIENFFKYHYVEFNFPKNTLTQIVNGSFITGYAYWTDDYAIFTDVEKPISYYENYFKQK